MSEEFCMDCGKELAMTGYEKLIKELADERDEARAEVERLKSEMNQARKFEVDSYVLLLQEKIKQLKAARPEPSRLEIAAQFYAAGYGPTEDALKRADALIAAAREGGK